MLKRSYSRALPLILAMWAYMMRTLTITPDANKFVEATEMLIPIILVPICAFILYDKTEIELALVCGTRTSKLFFTKLAPLVTYTVIPHVVFALIFESYTDGEFPSSSVTMRAIPEYVPENYKLLTIISITVTIVFFFALYTLIRVVTRNCYIPMLVCLGLSVTATSFRSLIVSMHIPMRYCLFDPQINGYFLGNTVPNAYAEKFPELELMTNVWTYNRLLFIGISAAIFFITYLILRREKLHCGIGE